MFEAKCLLEEHKMYVHQLYKWKSCKVTSKVKAVKTCYSVENHDPGQSLQFHIWTSCSSDLLLGIGTFYIFLGPRFWASNEQSQKDPITNEYVVI